MQQRSSRRHRWPAWLAASGAVLAAFLLPARSDHQGRVASAPRTTTASAAPDPSSGPASTSSTRSTPGPTTTPEPVLGPGSSVAPAALPDRSAATVASATTAAQVPAAPPEPSPTPTSPPALQPVAVGAAAVEAVLADVVPDPSSPSSTDAAPPELVAAVLTDDGHLVIDRQSVADATLGDLAAHIADQGDLVAAALDQTVQLTEPAVTDGSDATETAANDGLRSQQWALDAVPFESAWSTSTGAGVTVAVIDTAPDLTHPDLAGQFVNPYSFTAAGSGPGLQSVPPGNFHGTHVSGIIAALAGNGMGIAGGAPGVKILPIEVLGSDGSGRYSDIASAIVYAADQGVKVINLSLGGPSAFGPLEAAVNYATQHGALVVAASGNGGCTAGASGCAYNYPAAYPSALAIGSIGSNRACSSFTTRGSYVALGAPGGSIISTAPVGLFSTGYATASGTSMATPYAAAAAALVFAARPGSSPAQVRAALVGSAVDVADPGFDSCTGSGLIDPGAAIAALGGGSPSPGAGPLEAPRLAGALVGRSMVRLSIVAPAGATQLTIYRDGSPVAVVPASRRSYTDRSVTGRHPYTYTVSASAPGRDESAQSNAHAVTTRD